MFSKHLTARESRLAGGQAAVIFELFGLFGEVAAAHPEGKLAFENSKPSCSGCQGWLNASFKLRMSAAASSAFFSASASQPRSPNALESNA